VLAIALIVGSADVSAKILGSAFDQSVQKSALGIAAFVFGAAMPWGTFSIMEKLFPKLQIEYGPVWKRMKVSRSTFAGAITILLVPILINLLF
jgi:hypothetical protein